MPLTDDELADLIDRIVRAIRHNRFEARTRLRNALDLDKRQPEPSDHVPRLHPDF